MQMRDLHSRVIDYLRISITDRCNIRCIYCVPQRGLPFLPRKEILTYEEILSVVRVACEMGVKKVRVTGGEPLGRRNIHHFLQKLTMIESLEDVSVTTNGLLLQEHAKHLFKAGVRRINVSLDSLKPERYREITRGGDLTRVLDGLEEASRVGIAPIRINMVPMKGVNDDEIMDFARLTLTKDYQVRFIELMPVGPAVEGMCVLTDEVMERVSLLGELYPVQVRRSGPAQYVRLNGAKGMIGFISAVSNHFCETCNRLRLTADGMLRPCLFSETEIDLKTPLRRGDEKEIARLLGLAVEAKPKGHSLCNRKHLTRYMSRIGG